MLFYDLKRKLYFFCSLINSAVFRLKQLFSFKSLITLICILYNKLPFCSFSYLNFSVFSLDHGLHDIFFFLFLFCCLQRLLGGFDRFGGAIA